jgi:acyl transferase domain-containing protein
VDWAAVHSGKARRKISLPGYAFERQRHWIEPDRAAKQAPASPAPQARKGHAASAPASVESVILQQLEAMSHQLEMLRNLGKETAPLP